MMQEEIQRKKKMLKEYKKSTNKACYKYLLQGWCGKMQEFAVNRNDINLTGGLVVAGSNPVAAGLRGFLRPVFLFRLTRTHIHDFYIYIVLIHEKMVYMPRSNVSVYADHERNSHVTLDTF